MSIATQITRLNNNIESVKNTKQQIKDAVNNDFDIIANEQIESYANLIESGAELYKDYIPSTATEQATEISVDDAMKYSRNGLEIFGNTEQDSYTGVNKIALNIENTEYSHNYPSNYSSSYLTLKQYTQLSAGDYTMVFDMKSLNNGRFNKVHLKGPSNLDIVVFTLYRTIPITYTKYIKTFTIAEDTEIRGVFTQNAEGGDTFYFKDFMVIPGTYTEETIPAYESYVRTDNHLLHQIILKISMLLLVII